jgi:hypothetical protein
LGTLQGNDLIGFAVQLTRRRATGAEADATHEKRDDIMAEEWDIIAEEDDKAIAMRLPYFFVNLLILYYSRCSYSKYRKSEVSRSLYVPRRPKLL